MTNSLLSTLTKYELVSYQRTAKNAPARTATSRSTNNSVLMVTRRRPRATRLARRLARRRSRLLGAGGSGGAGATKSSEAGVNPWTGGAGLAESEETAATVGAEASPSSPTTTSTTTTVMLSLPPWVRAAWTSRSAACWGSGTEESTSLIWSELSSLVNPSLHRRYRSPRTGWILHRSTATPEATPRARVKMCRCGWTEASDEVSSPVRTI